MAGIVGALRRVNGIVGGVIGVALLAVGAFILVEIVLRQIGGAAGGSDEISGYMTAVIASWGFAYALVAQAHVRIDLVQTKLPGALRAGLDCLALGSMAAVALLVAFYGWDVLAKTLDSGARANTVLETPLWIPQTLWLSGWLWLAANALLLLAAALTMAFSGRFEAVQTSFGARGEAEE